MKALSSDRGGWILAETLIACLVAGGALSAAILLMRTSDETARRARADAARLAAAEVLLETARATVATAPLEQTGLTTDGAYVWRIKIDRVKATDPTSWRPGLAAIHVELRNTAGPPKTSALGTEVVVPARAPERRL